MSLQKQLVHLNMSGGLQKKDDSFLVIPSKLAVADDVEFDDLSTVKTRGGQASVSLATDVAPFGVGRAERLFAHQGRAYIESRGTALGVSLVGGVQRVDAGGGTYPVFHASTVGNFNNPYRHRRAGLASTRITAIAPKPSLPGASIPYYDGSFDFAVVDGVAYYAIETWNPSLGSMGLRVIAINEATGYRYYDGVLRDGTNVLVKPRVVVSPGKTVFVYFASFVSGSANFSIKVASIGATVSSINTVVTGAGTGGLIENTANDAALFDAAFSADGNRLGLVLRDSTAAGTTLRLYSLSTSDGYTISASGSGTASARITTLTCLVSYDGSKYRVHGFYGVNTNVAKGIYYDIGVGSSLETTVGTGAAGSTVGRVAAYENSTTQILLAFDAMTTVGTVINSTLRLAGFVHDYTGLTECASASPWVIAGRIGVVQSRLFLPMMQTPFLQGGTVFVVDMSDAFSNLGIAGTVGAAFQVLARLDAGECATTAGTRWQPTLRVPSFTTSGDKILLGYLKYETDLRLIGGYNDTPVCVVRADIDLQSQLGDAEINGVSFLAGACPYVFDGSNMVEEGFHHAPEIDVTAVVAAAGYELPNVAGDYVVCFTMAWTDAQGNWHESAPSNEVTFTVGANRFIPVTAVVAPPTQKPNARLVMYRTPLLGTDTSLYAATTSAGAYVTSDTLLVNGEQLYTAGNVLPNTPAPSCRHVSVFQKRLVLSGCGDGSRVHWSKQTTPGYGVEFSAGDPTHQTSVPSDKGRVVATEEMDDRLVVLCENGVGIISGTGPAPTGLAGQYSDFSSIITETGCSWDSPKSVTRGPEGVWFRSPFGIRLVSRSGSLARNQDGKQAGAEVDSLVSGSVVAVAGDTRQQVRFYQSSGTCLVWDYQWQQWTRFTGMANVDAVYADDRFYHLSNYSTTTPLLRYTTSRAGYEDVTSAGVPGAIFTATVETPWLSFAGIQGFQRVYRLMLLGKDAGTPGETHAITLSVYKDFDEGAPVETASVLAVTTSNGQIQVQHHFATQKCESMKLRITFGADPAGGEAALRLTDLTLQVGVKSGYNKLPSLQRF